MNPMQIIRIHWLESNKTDSQLFMLSSIWFFAVVVVDNIFFTSKSRGSITKMCTYITKT